ERCKQVALCHELWKPKGQEVASTLARDKQKEGNHVQINPVDPPACLDSCNLVCQNGRCATGQMAEESAFPGTVGGAARRCRWREAVCVCRSCAWLETQGVGLSIRPHIGQMGAAKPDAFTLAPCWYCRVPGQDLRVRRLCNAPSGPARVGADQQR